MGLKYVIIKINGFFVLCFYKKEPKLTLKQKCPQSRSGFMLNYIRQLIALLMYLKKNIFSYFYHFYSGGTDILAYSF